MVSLKAPPSRQAGTLWPRFWEDADLRALDQGQIQQNGGEWGEEVDLFHGSKGRPCQAGGAHGAGRTFNARRGSTSNRKVIAKARIGKIINL
jgi:hypothetical protein